MLKLNMDLHYETAQPDSLEQRRKKISTLFMRETSPNLRIRRRSEGNSREIQITKKYGGRETLKSLLFERVRRSNIDIDAHSDSLNTKSKVQQFQFRFECGAMKQKHKINSELLRHINYREVCQPEKSNSIFCKPSFFLKTTEKCFRFTIKKEHQKRRHTEESFAIDSHMVSISPSKCTEAIENEGESIECKEGESIECKEGESIQFKEGESIECKEVSLSIPENYKYHRGFKPSKARVRRISEQTEGRLQKIRCNIQVVMESYGLKQSVPANFNDLPRFSINRYSLKYFVGAGNNRELVMRLMRNRWWWTPSNSIHGTHFVWTQIKIRSLLQPQSSISRTQQVEQIHVQEEIAFGNTFQSLQHQQNKTKQIQSVKCLHNHYIENNQMGNKKSLFCNLWLRKSSDLSSLIPETHLIDSEAALQVFLSRANKGQVWILKPGQDSNRGHNIIVTNEISQIKEYLGLRLSETVIIQKYLTELTLYNTRKFDIRTYLLLSTISSCTKCYFYADGYVRTSSYPFDPQKFKNKYIHLTNDAVQCSSKIYSKYQKGNKLSYPQLQQYISAKGGDFSVILTKMKTIATAVCEAIAPSIAVKSLQNGFEVFGLDYILMSNFEPLLLEVNTNPCLELSCPLLEKVIPKMLESAFRLSLDPIYPPTMLPAREHLYSNYGDSNNCFSIIYEYDTRK